MGGLCAVDDVSSGVRVWEVGLIPAPPRHVISRKGVNCFVR
jgi:hypothetical protein